ncbi:hypothetical protein JCM15548_1746 [Geofilum rubicundum JCM 15548]|uniref:SWIM-type domain-containing protein n=2 Tax=Geofilum TaxID=1236988 RepID=A0A0E9LTK4_9BACT|nr:hypothetical protein JCM15548_1746 [Geofilum rubicundum JCM 15548]
MQLYLDNFDSEIDPVIVDRGLAYYYSNAITEAVEYPEGHWTASVEGSDDYTVTIDFLGNKVLDWDCDCPYDKGPVCKHVVAVLRYVKNLVKGDESIGVTKSNDEKSQQLSSLETATNILSRMTDNDLRDFVSQQLHFDDLFLNSFLMAFPDKDQSKLSEDRYRQIIREIALKAADRYGYIDYYHADDFVSPVLSLLDDASKRLTKSNVDETFALVSVIMEETPELAMEMDDSGGGIMMIWEDALEVMCQINELAQPAFKDVMFNYFVTQLPFERYNNLGLDDSLLSLLGKLAYTKEQEKCLLELIDQRIRTLGKEFNIRGLLQIKIDFFERQGRLAEAWEVVTANLNITEFRMKVIDRFIFEKKFDEARRFCREGIILEKGDRYAWSPGSKYKEKLLEIAQKEPNKKEILALAEDLFYSTQYQIKYFKLLKDNWPKEGWEKKRNLIIDRIKGSDAKGSFQSAFALAKIFSEEELYDRLLKLLQINQTFMVFVDEYAKIIAGYYPAEVVELYSQAILNYAEATGRPVYNETVKYLKNLSDLAGGKDVAARLVSHFRQVYKNRKA